MREEEEEYADDVGGDDRDDVVRRRPGDGEEEMPPPALPIIKVKTSAKEKRPSSRKQQTRAALLPPPPEAHPAPVSHFKPGLLAKSFRGALETLARPNKATEEAEKAVVDSVTRYVLQTTKDYIKIARSDDVPSHVFTRDRLVDLLREQGLLPGNQTIGDAARRLLSDKAQIDAVLGVSELMR